MTRPRRRRTQRETPPIKAVQEPVQPVIVQAVPLAQPDVPLGFVTTADGAAVSSEQLDKLPLTKEEKDRISLQAALAREAEILENDDRVEGGDKFGFDRRIIPAGWDYQWRTDTVLNLKDPSYHVDLAKMGWRPVPANRHPDMMPSGWTGEHIMRGGMLLMEMPLVSVQRARQAEHRKALEAVRVKEDQLNGTPPGTFSRRGQTSKSFGPIDMPAPAPT